MEKHWEQHDIQEQKVPLEVTKLRFIATFIQLVHLMKSGLASGLAVQGMSLEQWPTLQPTSKQ